MVTTIPQDQPFLRAVLDANPNLMFVVDGDVRLIEFNRAAGDLLSARRDRILGQRGGEVLHCIHSTETPEGCGHAPYCQACVVRNSVREAFQGRQVIRRKTKLELLADGKIQELFVLITTSPFQYENQPLVLLVIENITELEEIRRMLPICSKCKKIRDDNQYWAELEAYFKSHLDLDFTHGLCPECLEEFAEEIKEYHTGTNRERAESETPWKKWGP